MTKKNFVILALLIVLVIGVSYYFNTSTKTKSLANHILTGVDFNKLNSILLLDSNANAKIRDLHEDESIQVLEILKKVELTSVREDLVSTPEDYILVVSGSGGNFRLYLSSKGVVFISDDFKKGYQFVDEKILNDLLNIITKKHP